MKKKPISLVWIAFILSVITTKASAQNGYIGEIRLFAGNFPPKGWAFCTGQILSISANNALFSIIGTIYGGNGTSTFALPDFRGKVAMGMGQGSDLADIELGEVTGKEYLTLEEKNMPRHSHNLSGTISTLDITANGKSVPFFLYVSEQTVKDSITTFVSGSAYPFDNRQPSIGLNYIICLQGTFPSRSSGFIDTLSVPDPFSYTGEVKLFAGNFAINNWDFCNGKKIEKTGHELLFNTIETSFNNTSTTFFLPDLCGRIVIGSGQGTGLTNRKRGERVGSKQIQLQENNIPHSHRLLHNSTDEEKLNEKNYFIPLEVPAPVSSSIGSGQAGGNSTPLTNIQPSLAINYLICLKGKSKQINYNYIGYIGEIRSIAGNDIPEGWVLCDGRSMKSMENEGLLSLISTTFGGDYVNTFNIPDLRGRAVIGLGSGINMGDTIGAETTQLEAKNLPPHVHKFDVMEDKNIIQSSVNTTVLAVKRSNRESYTKDLFTDKATGVMPIDNMQPSLVLNYIICVSGYYPSKN